MFFDGWKSISQMVMFQDLPYLGHVTLVREFQKRNASNLLKLKHGHWPRICHFDCHIRCRTSKFIYVPLLHILYSISCLQSLQPRSSRKPGGHWEIPPRLGYSRLQLIGSCGGSLWWSGLWKPRAQAVTWDPPPAGLPGHQGPHCFDAVSYSGLIFTRCMYLSWPHGTSTLESSSWKGPIVLYNSPQGCRPLPHIPYLGRSTLPLPKAAHFINLYTFDHLYIKSELQTEVIISGSENLIFSEI